MGFGARRGMAFMLTQELFSALCSRERQLLWILHTDDRALFANFPSYVLLFCLTSKGAATWLRYRLEPHLCLGVSPLLLTQLLVYMWQCLFTAKIALMAVRLASGSRWCLLCCCLVSLGLLDGPRKPLAWTFRSWKILPDHSRKFLIRWGWGGGGGGGECYWCVFLQLVLSAFPVPAFLQSLQ